MKIRRPTLKILLSEADKLDQEGERLREMLDQLAREYRVLNKDAKEWIHEVEARDNGYRTDQYYINIVRKNLETAITNYRKTLANVYDYMGDKGLV